MEGNASLKCARKHWRPPIKEDRAPSFLGLLRIRFAGTVMVVAAMHEVHDRTGQQDEVRRDERNMHQVKDQQIDAHRRGDEGGEQSRRRSQKCFES